MMLEFVLSATPVEARFRSQAQPKGWAASTGSKKQNSLGSDILAAQFTTENGATNLGHPFGQLSIW